MALHVAPDVREPIAAVTACGRCQNTHTPALVAEWPPVPPEPSAIIPWMDVYDGSEGRE